MASLRIVFYKKPNFWEEYTPLCFCKRKNYDFLKSDLATMRSDARLIIALVFSILHYQNSILGNLKHNHINSQSVLMITQA